MWMVMIKSSQVQKLRNVYLGIKDPDEIAKHYFEIEDNPSSRYYGERKEGWVQYEET